MSWSEELRRSAVRHELFSPSRSNVENVPCALYDVRRPWSQVTTDIDSIPTAIPLCLQQHEDVPVANSFIGGELEQVRSFSISLTPQESLPTQQGQYVFDIMDERRPCNQCCIISWLSELIIQKKSGQTYGRFRRSGTIPALYNCMPTWKLGSELDLFVFFMFLAWIWCLSDRTTKLLGTKFSIRNESAP